MASFSKKDPTEQSTLVYTTTTNEAPSDVEFCPECFKGKMVEVGIDMKCTECEYSYHYHCCHECAGIEL